MTYFRRNHKLYILHLLQKAINKYYCSIYKCIYDDTE